MNVEYATNAQQRAADSHHKGRVHLMAALFERFCDDDEAALCIFETKAKFHQERSAHEARLARRLMGVE